MVSLIYRKCFSFASNVVKDVVYDDGSIRETKTNGILNRRNTNTRRKTAEGQWLKAIRFRFPINPEGDSDGLDDIKPPETVVLLRKKNVKPKDYVEIDVDIEDYYKIKEDK